MKLTAKCEEVGSAARGAHPEPTQRCEAGPPLKVGRGTHPARKPHASVATDPREALDKMQPLTIQGQTLGTRGSGGFRSLVRNLWKSSADSLFHGDALNVPPEIRRKARSLLLPPPRHRAAKQERVKRKK